MKPEYPRPNQQFADLNTHNFLTIDMIVKPPVLKDTGKLAIQADFTKKADEVSSKLNFDEDQAILKKPLLQCWKEKTWEYQTAKYSYITAMREDKIPVEVITANILVKTKIDDEDYILLQQRSENSGLYPGYYSIFGGSFSPREDNGDIYLTAVRELYEEIEGIKTSKGSLLKSIQNAKILLTQETDSGNLQINFLDVEIEIDSDTKGFEDEGDLIKIKKDDIESFLTNNKEKITPLAIAALEVSLYNQTAYKEER